MKKIFLLIVVTFFCISVDAQESKLPVFITDSLDNYITTAMAKWQIPGLSVAIVKDGKVALAKGYGVKKLGSKEPVDENTLFMIGSNTKAFTATTITILQEEGKINLNDKVQKWLPEFKLKDQFASNEIIIADLLSHRIGFGTFQGDFTYWTSNLSRAEVIGKMALVNPLYKFRTKYGYCNAAFLVAGEIIPQAIGVSWEETVKEKILKPLKMENTLMLSEDLEKASNKALPYTLVDNKLCELEIPHIDNLAPCGSMSSSASEMTHWLIAQLDTGKFDGNIVIPKNALLAIRNPYSIVRVNPRDKQQNHFSLYGLGLDISDYNGKMVYGHTGGVDGYLSSLMFIPEIKLGVVVLTNNDQNNLFGNLRDQIRDAFLDLPYKNLSDISFERFTKDVNEEKAKIDSLKKIISENNKPALPLEDYTGKYTSELYGDVEVRLEDNKLNIYFSHHPGLVGKLEHIEKDNYLCTYSNPSMGIKEIPFKIDDGEVIGFTLHVADFVEYTPYEFVKE